MGSDSIVSVIIARHFVDQRLATNQVDRLNFKINFKVIIRTSFSLAKSVIGVGVTTR